MQLHQIIKETIVAIDYTSSQSIAKGIDMLSLTLHPFNDADRAIVDQLNILNEKVTDGQGVT